MVGDAGSGASPELWTQMYPELKRLARSRLRRGGPNAMLNTTGLINEAYLRVAGVDMGHAASPDEFLAYAARTMRSVVVDLIRENNAQRRGGDMARVTLDTAVIDAASMGRDEPLEIDEALKSLAAVDPRLCAVVEMRYFGGFNDAEIATALRVTPRTVGRDWVKACVLLRSMLDDSA